MNETVRLLRADDSESVRRAICVLLAQDPKITVSGEARNYAEVLKILSESNPDVVLMDLHMPDESKFDAASIKTRLRGSCLIAMSIWTDAATVSLARSLGVY